MTDRVKIGERPRLNINACCSGEDPHLAIDQVKKISTCHLRGGRGLVVVVVVDRNECLHRARGVWGGRDFLEWGNMENTLAAYGKEKFMCWGRRGSKGWI